MRYFKLNAFRFVTCVLFLFFISCGSGNKNGALENLFTPSRFDEDDFAEALEARFKNIIDKEAWDRKKIHTVPEALQYIYQANSFLPIWITEKGNTDHADAFLKELEGLEEEGLTPARYNINYLRSAIKKFRDDKETSVDAVVALDTAITAGYLQASRDLLLGRVRPALADSLWFHENDTAWRAPQLLFSSLLQQNVYPSLDSFRSKIATYGMLLKAKKHYKVLASNDIFIKAKQLVKADKKALDSLFVFLVKAEVPYPVGSGDDASGQGRAQILNSFQHYYGLNPTGRFDERTMQYLTRPPDSVMMILDANLERLRWMPQQLEAEFVIVDVPMMELYLQRDGDNVMQMNVIVGKTVRQTPSLNADMTNIVFNPPWGVPPTILKKDVLPGMQKKGKAYLREKNLEIFDYKGNRVDASRVNASNYKQFVFKQPPGDDNALGFIKFNLPNDHDIYLHDTPHRELFDIYDRAQSSGCVRVQKPRELAEYILADMDKQPFDRLAVDSLIRTQKTKYQNLKNKIPVHIVYMTAFGSNNEQSVRFARDIYKRDAKLIAMLK